MKAKLFTLAMLAMGMLVFTSCKDDDEPKKGGNYYEEAQVFIRLQDEAGKTVNDSTTLARLVDYTDRSGQLNYMSDMLFTHEMITKENGQWYYAIVLNELKTPAPDEPANRMLRATIKAGKRQYQLAEKRFVSYNEKRKAAYHHTAWLEVDGQRVTTDQPGKPGTYIHLIYK